MQCHTQLPEAEAATNQPTVLSLFYDADFHAKLLNEALYNFPFAALLLNPF